MRAKKDVSEQQQEVPKQQIRRTHGPGWLSWYEHGYKKLLLIPIIIFIAAVLQIGWQYAATGDFVLKGISLEGGVSITVTADPGLSIQEIESTLQGAFPEHQVMVRNLQQRGERIGVLIESDMESLEARDALVEAVRDLYGGNLSEDALSVESTGSVLGEDFFRQTSIALLVAFIFMGIVVFLFFRSIVTSLAIIWAALFDIVVTIAIVNILGIRLSTAGVAAFLMLVGYAVDTNILLSNKLLKRKGEAFSKVVDAAKTGLMMTLTTLAALLVALFVTESQVIAQIMTILVIGLCVDMISTWIQNAGILRMYVEGKD